MQRKPLQRKNSVLSKGNGFKKQSSQSLQGSKSGLKRKSGTIRSKPKTTAEIEENKEAIEKQWQMFLEIWDERPHRSEVSGKWLGSEPLTVFFDHLLEKGVERYEHLRYEKENIILVTWEEHTAKGNGFPLPAHKAAIERAKIRFNVQ